MKRVLINRSIYFALILIFIITNSCQKRTEVVLRASEKIVFLSNREAPKRQFDIFSMNFDGSGQLNLTQNVDGIRSISNPRISPDGKEIVFIVFETGRKLLQKMNIDGSNQKTLTEIKIDVPDPRFSPDGTRIIYVDKIQQHRQIFIMDRDGGNRTNISNRQNDEFEARFAPDGSRIVYVTKHSNKHSICVMNIDGSNKTELTEKTTDDRYPQFSPDGSKIVFSSSRDGDYDIYLMKKSGRSIKKIFDSPSSETEPLFSPDGRNIIFISIHSFRPLILQPLLRLSSYLEYQVWRTICCFLNLISKILQILSRSLIIFPLQKQQIMMFVFSEVHPGRLHLRRVFIYGSGISIITMQIL